MDASGTFTQMLSIVKSFLYLLCEFIKAAVLEKVGGAKYQHVCHLLIAATRGFSISFCFGRGNLCSVKMVLEPSMVCTRAKRIFTILRVSLSLNSSFLLLRVRPQCPKPTEISGLSVFICLILLLQSWVNDFATRYLCSIQKGVLLNLTFLEIHAPRTQVFATTIKKCKHFLVIKISINAHNMKYVCSKFNTNLLTKIKGFQ